AWVIAGSRRVQSARTNSTPRSAKAFFTSASPSTSFLLTWQVTHHAAVKSTKTALLADSSVTSAGVNGCQGSFAADVGFACTDACTSVGATKSGHATTATAT